MAFVSEVSSNQPVTDKGWTPLQVLVVALCIIINMLDGMDVMIIAYVAPSMAQSWGVDFAALGVIFSAGLVGMMVGCVVLAPFADTYGRRPMILLGLALMTIGMIGTGYADGIPSFLAYRLVAGIGIGALLASLAAIASEYAPPSQRSFAIGLFQAGYPIGAVLTGAISVWAIPAFGWQNVLVGAGMISAAILPIAYFLLPESVEFLESRQPKNALARSNGLRQRLGWPTLAALPEKTTSGNAPGIRKLFADGFWKPTMLLWFSTFLSFVVLYFVTSWIPKLAIQAGLSSDNALWAGSIFNLGGFIGALSIGWFAMRRRIGWLILVYATAAAFFLVVFGVPMPLVLTLVVAGFMGMFLQGSFSGYYSLAAKLYPAEVRSSGIGWAVGIGRGGAVFGPLLGGYLLSMNLPLWIIFLCFAVPLVASGILAWMVRTE